MQIACPVCRTIIESPPSGTPTCPNCGYGRPGGPALPATQRTDGFAITSLICGIGGFLVSPLVGVVGVVFGVLALNRIKAQGTKGYGMAVAGIICGATSAILMLAFASLFGFGFGRFWAFM